MSYDLNKIGKLRKMSKREKEIYMLKNKLKKLEQVSNK